ncbi:MAG: SDR family oxidoreductase [Alphaproteobacteria bacterium]|nr:SDR family oxidoreductase [Alphaproteobacteria bacterium]
MTSSHKLFCFGFGYTAAALAGALRAEGWSVAGTCRDEAKRAALAGQGIEAHLFGRDCPLDPAAFQGADAVLVSIPPDGEGDPVAALHGQALDARWVGYLSTTGVYGDRQGGWVDEDSARDAVSARGKRRVAAEDAWLALHKSHGVPAHLFRLAGIYGPGRSALDAVRAGTARRIDKPGQVFSRIHVLDIVQTLRVSIAKPAPGRAYNLADDCPAPPQDVIAYACELLGTALPPLVPFAETQLSEMARSFYAECKRVRNGRIKSELGVALAYPDYKAGLKALRE